MIRIIKYLSYLVLFFITINSSLHAQNNFSLGTSELGVRAVLNNDGSIQSLAFGNGPDEQKVNFRNDDWRGPGFGKEVHLSQDPGNPSLFKGNNKGMNYSISYSAYKNGLRIFAEVENTTDVKYVPDRLSLQMGIDTYMEKFPQWNDLYFPTFFRCEKQSFWGYMMTPKGKILSITSPDPVASYLINYIPSMYGHYIYTVSLDLLCQPPVPFHHPESTSLEAGEKRKWQFDITPLNNQKEILPHAANTTSTPIINLERHSLEPDQTVSFTILGNSRSRVEMKYPSGKRELIGEFEPNKKIDWQGTNIYGLYWMTTTNEKGNTSTASFYVHPPWSWYLKQARLESMRLTPRACLENDACETWYGLFGFYLASKYFPEPALDKAGDEILDQVLKRLFKEDNGLIHTVVYNERIQNVSSMISILADKYECTKDIGVLEPAVKMADYILSRQHEKGFYGGYHMSHYTSVIYIAKSILELMDVIQPLAQNNKLWSNRYEKYGASVKRAMDELVSRGRDIKTEGDATFEDGAVSCSSLQLLDYALRQSDPIQRKKYADAGLQYLEDHSCLTRLWDPDARSHGGTSRWWESWGDVRSPMQIMLSPHGWSGWRLYASYYAYLLTGEEDRLIQFMDAMGACSQLMSWPEGKLYDAFNPDPRIMAGELKPDINNPSGLFEKKIIGQDYIKTIGSWYGKNTEGSDYLDRTKWDWTGDGTAYEIFKAMEECVLISAFVCERNDGSLLTYNCTANYKGKSIIIIPNESIIKNVHINLKHSQVVTVVFEKNEITRKMTGIQWITKHNLQ